MSAGDDVSGAGDVTMTSTPRAVPCGCAAGTAPGVPPGWRQDLTIWYGGVAAVLPVAPPAASGRPRLPPGPVGTLWGEAGGGSGRLGAVSRL